MYSFMYYNMGISVIATEWQRNEKVPPPVHMCESVMVWLPLVSEGLGLAEGGKVGFSLGWAERLFAVHGDIALC